VKARARVSSESQIVAADQLTWESLSEGDQARFFGAVLSLWPEGAAALGMPTREPSPRGAAASEEEKEKEREIAALHLAQRTMNLLGTWLSYFGVEKISLPLLPASACDMLLFAMGKHVEHWFPDDKATIMAYHLAAKAILHEAQRPARETGRDVRVGLEKGRNMNPHPPKSAGDIRAVQEALNAQRQRSPHLSKNGMIKAAQNLTGVSERTIWRYLEKGKLSMPPTT